jgi:hypothetical protein
MGWWPISMETGEPRAARPQPLGGDGGGGFRQAGTGDGCEKGARAPETHRIELSTAVAV